MKRARDRDAAARFRPDLPADTLTIRWSDGTTEIVDLEASEQSAPGLDMDGP
ncbi:hypothetical protein [Palleronia marisminoris]|uniref:hypothetical protein n=1 Tax=Palleronia marisminoris TaxID=315423 RepID=UPI0015876271|nr:hypothetical protein [Palleronia marisminoris]